jgi:hypothetical protein
MRRVARQVGDRVAATGSAGRRLLVDRDQRRSVVGELVEQWSGFRFAVGQQ